jgi:hypothetical protein
VQWNQIAKQAINIFSRTDPTFSSDFNNIITESVCELTAPLFEDWQVEYCKNSTHYQILQKGALAGMEFLQRETMNALITMQNSNSVNRT